MKSSEHSNRKSHSSLKPIQKHSGPIIDKLNTKGVVSPSLSNPKDKDSMKFDDAEKADILLHQFHRGIGR